MTGDRFKTGGALEGLEAMLGGKDDPVVGQAIGNYRVRELMAEGGMGRVYRAVRDDGQFDRDVAVKVLPPDMGKEYIERFRQERRILASLSHPNIAQLFDAGLADSGSLFLVMELVDGLPIDEYASKHDLSTRAKAGLIRSLCDALAFAHSKLVVHRDLKPSNVFVNVDGDLKLLDFGIAKILESPDDVTVETRPMTPRYASPEQLLNEPISVASDIYQIGLLFLSLFEQREDVEAETQASATERAVKKNSITVESRIAVRLPAELTAIINKCLRADPAERYESASELASDLRNYLGGFPVTARKPGWWYRTRKFLRRNLAASVTVTTLIAMLLTGNFLYLNALARSRAAAELEAEQSARVTEFLVDLFRAAEPNAPADQLPTTADLLDLGARRALDPSSAPPEERLRMLMILGEVLLEQSRYDQAQLLLDAAVDLARASSPPQPDTLARALSWRAYLDWRGGSLAHADELLREAESLVAGMDEHINIWARVVSDRAWIATVAGDHKRAAALLQPAIEVVRSRTDIQPRTAFRALERQSSIHQKLGNLEYSARLRAESEPYLLSAYSPESRTHAIFLANSSNLEYRLGRFESALQMNTRALEMYNDIYAGQPVTFRAVARRNLVRKLLTAGRFDEGLTELIASTTELAQVRSQSPDEDSSHHYHHGEMMLLMRRWAEAAQYLGRARAMTQASGDASQSLIQSITAMQVWALCQQSAAELRGVRPAALEALLVEPATMGGDVEARIRSARACVHWRNGKLESAKSEIELALDLVTDAGALLERAERMIMHGQILNSMGDIEAAQAQVGAAVELFAVHGLDDHPNVAAFKRLEQELAGAPKPADAAPVR